MFHTTKVMNCKMNNDSEWINDLHQWTKKATLIRIMGGGSTGINAYCLRKLKIDIYLTINCIAILTNS